MSDSEREMEAGARNMVWRQIASGIADDVIQRGGTVEATIANVRGWWENPEGYPVEAGDPRAVKFNHGVWTGLGSEVLRKEWFGLWTEDKEWLWRKTIPGPDNPVVDTNALAAGVGDQTSDS